MKKRMGTEEIDASLQDFTCSYLCGSRLEKLSFSTFKTRWTPSEREEILSIYTNRCIALQCSGHEVVVQNEEELENVRTYFASRRSLGGEHKSVRWKLYWSRDADRFPAEKVFVGLCGLSLTEYRHLEPHIRMTPEYQNKGIGTKVMFCLLEKVLGHKAWLYESVQGVSMNIHPMNEASLILKDKLLSEHAVEEKNPDDERGIWHKVYLFSHDRRKRVVDIRQFLCNDVKSLETLWESRMNQSVNKADFVLLNDWGDGFQLCLKKRPLAIEDSNSLNTTLETLDEFSKELMDGIVDNFSREFETDKKKVRTVATGEPLVDIDASLQVFAYTFECGSRREKLSFRTFKERKSPSDHEEIMSVYGSPEIMLQCSGIDGFSATEEGLEGVRAWLSARRSLSGEFKSIRWKLYYCHDVSADNSEEVFAGFCGLSLNQFMQLEPSILLRPECQKKGIGSKVAFCFGEMFLKHKAYWSATVRGIVTNIHPVNGQSLILNHKLLADCSVENQNPDDENGTWPCTYIYGDNKFRTMPMRSYVCSDLKLFETFWEEKMNVRVNKADLVFSSNASPDNGGRMFLLEDIDLEHYEQKAASDDRMEESLQEFSYSFMYCEAAEKFTFRTFRQAVSANELDVIWRLFGNAESSAHVGAGVPLQTKEQAKILRNHMRKAASFSSRKAMQWKLQYTSGVSKEALIGIVSLHADKRHVLPEVCLLPEYRRKGLAVKACLCLILRLFSNKYWFLRSFDGIRTLVHPKDTRGLKLRERVLGDSSEEIRNPEQAQFGLWVVTEKNHVGGSDVHKVLRRRFECNGEAELETLMMTTFTKRNNRNKLSFWQDTFNKELVRISLLKRRPDLGVYEVYLDTVQVQRLVLSWRLSARIDNSETLPAIVSVFDIRFPQVVESLDKFYLFFFMGETGLHDFEAVFRAKHVHRRCNFIAFSALRNGRNCLEARFIDPCFECVTGYLVEIDIESLDTPPMGFKHGIKRLWATPCFQWKNVKYRSAKLSFPDSVQLNRLV